MRPGRCLPEKVVGNARALCPSRLPTGQTRMIQIIYRLFGRSAKSPLPSRSDATPSQGRGDKGRQLRQCPREERRAFACCGLLAAQKRVPLEEVSARGTVFSTFAQLSLPAEQKSARRKPSKPSRANAFQRMANLRAEKFHSMTQTPEVKQRPRRTRSQHLQPLFVEREAMDKLFF